MDTKAAYWSAVVILLLAVASSAGVQALDTLEVFSPSGTILDMEQLYATSCLEDAAHVEHVLYCLDNFASRSLDVIPWGDGCYLSFIDLYGFDCNKPSVQVLYQGGGQPRKITESFTVDKVQTIPQRILETQAWDGGWDTPSDTAYSLWILSQDRQRYTDEMAAGIAWLKAQRDDDEKCWPISLQHTSCSVYETARTLAFLTLAGYNSSERVYNDALFWLEGRQNYLREQDDEWTVRIEPDDDASCTIAYAGSEVFDDEINDSEYGEVTIEPAYGALINASCVNETLKMTIVDGYGVNLFSRDFDDEDDDYDYSIRSNEIAPGDRFRIPPPCWSAGEKWRFCNKKTTLYATIADVPDTPNDLAKDWLESQLSNSSIRGKYLSTDEEYLDTAMYLYTVDTDNDDVLDWLIYQQNNDGSWADGSAQDKVSPTAMSILALQNQTFPSSTQVLQDARKWISSQTPFSGWSEVKDDALSFMVLKDNAKPVVRVEGEVPVSLTGSASLLLMNPTAFNVTGITYGVSGDIEGHIGVNGPSQLAPYQNQSMTISPQGDTAGLFSGLINIGNSSRSFVSVPVVLSRDLSLIITSGDMAHVFDGVAFLEMSVAEANARFSCTLSWDDGRIPDSQFTIATAGSTTVSFETTLNESVYASGSVVCKHADFSSITPVAAQFQLYDEQPISFNPESLSISKPKRNSSITVTNNMDFPIDVAISEDISMYGLIIKDQQFTLDPNERYEVAIINTIFEGENVTGEGMITLEALEQKYEIPLVVDVMHRESILGLFITLFILLIVLCGLGAGGYFGYKNREELKSKGLEWYVLVKHHVPNKLLPYLPKTPEEKRLIALRKGQEKTERSYFEEIVEIMKGMNKSDVAIRERLKAEGLTDGQVDDILADYNEVQHVKESLKHEDEVLGLLKTVGDDSTDVFGKLKEHGFSEKQVHDAIAELSREIEEKKKDIEKDRE